MNHGTVNNNVNVNVYMSGSPMPAECCADGEDLATARTDLNDKYGAEAVNKALQHLMFEGLKEAIKSYINEQNGPEALQDEGMDIVECCGSGYEGELSPEMLDEIRESPVGKEAVNSGMEELIERFAEEQSKREFERVDEATGVAEKKKGGGAGGGEGSSESGGSDGGFDVSGKGMNWLVQLATALAEIQDKFLTAALEATEVMADSADNATDLSASNELSGQEQQTELGSFENQTQDEPDDKADFLKAQAQYSANIQMFTTMANQTATSIKSIGEGLSAISRKQ